MQDQDEYICLNQMRKDRQKAALVVMGVEQRELLMAVHRVAGIVDVERDRARRAPVAFAELIDQRRHQPGDLDLRRRIFQPRHGRLRA
jgi:chemotaxis signal transduction protein